MNEIIYLKFTRRKSRYIAAVKLLEKNRYMPISVKMEGTNRNEFFYSYFNKPIETAFIKWLKKQKKRAA